MTVEAGPVRSLRDVPPAGMTAVLSAARARGFRPGHAEWVNLGQGQPETGDIAGAPPRVTKVTLEPADHAYGPISGVRELRDALAAHYNRLYRHGRASQYTGDNISIAAGGRIALNRAVAALDAGGGGPVIGFALPDYAAYHDILARNVPRLRPLRSADPTTVDAFLMSNPRNPTGEVISGDALRTLVGHFVASGTTLIVDEFYSHYVYEPAAGHGHEGGAAFGPAERPVGAAEHVEDVDSDPVLIIDGLTKNFRYPGWRLGWIVGPAEFISAVERVAQDLDGGTSQIVQRAALEVLSPARADQETAAVRAAFARKRNIMVDGLRSAGVHVDPEPRGTFYVWGNLADLPKSLNDARRFFDAALDQRVIVVPGDVFDLDPAGGGRSGAFSRHVRFSFGPPEASIAEGLRRISHVVEQHS